MSAPENVGTRARVLTILFWVGIALAPLAALLLVVAGSSTGGLRFAAIMAIIAVVAVGLSITMRRDASSTKLDLEETLLDEIDMLRDDVRADITTAARATHKALTEKVASLQETIDYLRRQAEAARAAADDRPPSRPRAPGQSRRVPGGPMGPAGVVRHTETVQVTTRQTFVDPGDDERGYEPSVYVPASRPGAGYRTDYERDDRLRVPPDDDRHGWDDPRRDDRGREDRGRDDIRRRFDHGDRALHDARRDDARAAWAVTAAREESWAEQKLREFTTGRPSDSYSDSGDSRAYRQSHSGRDDDPADDDRWSAMRAGDRWAEVRSDEHSRELRMGERRAAVRTDETGTQLRIMDRWSSVRQEMPRTDGRWPSWSGTYQDDEDTGETRRERREREEAEQLAEDDRRLGRRRAAINLGEPSRWSESARPALPASEPTARRDDRVRDDRARDDRARDDRVREVRPPEDRARDDYVRDDHLRDDRARDDRPRDDRLRRDGLRDDHVRSDRARDDRPRTDGLRDDRVWDGYLRDHRVRDDRVRDDRLRDDRLRDDRPVEARRPRDDRLREDAWSYRGDEPRRDGYRREDHPLRDAPRQSPAAQLRVPVPRAEDPRAYRRALQEDRPIRRDHIPLQRSAPPPRRDDRGDDRWEREPSDPRPTVRPRRLDFEVTDDRWR